MSDQDEKPADVPALKRALALRFKQVRDDPNVRYDTEVGSVAEQRLERALMAIYALGREDALSEQAVAASRCRHQRVRTLVGVVDSGWCEDCGALAMHLEDLPDRWDLPTRARPTRTHCDHPANKGTVIGAGQYWCVQCGSLDLGKGWLMPSDPLLVTDLLAPQEPDGQRHLRAVEGTAPGEEPHQVYRRIYNRALHGLSSDDAHRAACKELFQLGTSGRRVLIWPPSAGDADADTAALLYNATWDRLHDDGRSDLSAAQTHMLCCAELQREIADSRDLQRQAAARRAAQLRQLVERLLDGTLERAAVAEPIDVPMAQVQPTDLLLRRVNGRDVIEYVEASAPSFRGSMPDTPERGWSLHTIRVDNRPGHQSDGASHGGTGGERCTVHRLVHAPVGWTCPTCLCTNGGEACTGCGTTKTERAIYQKRVDEGVGEP